MGKLFTFLLIAQSVYWDHDPGIIAPRPMEKTAAEYTDEARLARLEGSVLVTLRVDADATVRDVHVSRSLGFGLDQQAVEAVRQWKFLPGTKEGNPVPVLTRAEVNFRLLTGRNDWYLDRASFDTPRGSSDPVLIATEFPEPAEASAEIVVSFDVDPAGTVASPRVETSSDPRFDDRVLAAIAKWKFRPVPEKIHATFAFHVGPPAMPASRLLAGWSLPSRSAPM
ncbi:MAG: energy transducer TonB [Acidobacteriia bacterium]|nr:energy transducer TonB [Terriglobia bacterium]